MASILRTRFGKEIVTEFLAPTRKSNKVAILSAGAPGYPGGKTSVMEHLAHRGYWSFIPRYRGTWESDGTFLEHSPEEDIRILIDELAKPFQDIWSTTEYAIPSPEFYLIGGSFGGPAAILGSRDSRVVKAAAISPVIDWRAQENTVEPLHLMSEYVPKAFGPMYRADPSAWQKLSAGNFYNPIDEKETVDGKKLLIMHSKDDVVVHFGPAQTFAKEVGARFVPFSYKGHMGVGKTADPFIWKHIDKFFKGK